MAGSLIYGTKIIETLAKASGICPSTIRNNAKSLLLAYLDGDIDEAKRVKNPIKTISS